jgi:hypothetical protein
MTADYSGAQWVPCKNFWPGGNSMQKIVIHGTASGGPQTGYQLATSAEYNDGNTASSHYIVDVDGTVYQTVAESDSAWGNCCVTGNEAPAGYFPIPGTADYHLNGLIASGHNYNHDTISIENIKSSSDNSEALTPLQYEALVKLVADIATRRHILPVKGSLIGHFDLDPINRARCPGTFDWSEFYRDVQTAMGYGPINPSEARAYALSAGFVDENVDTIVAIAQAESDLMPLRQGINTDGSLDRGILQINSHWHAEVTEEQAYNPTQSFVQAFRISGGGADFNAWNTYKNGSYKQFIEGVQPMLSSTGEVADFCDADQFQPSKTQDACGFFAVACVDAAAPAGSPCTKTVAAVIAEAENWYAQYNGDNSISNQDGMTTAQEYQLLKQVGLQYYPLNNDVNQIRQWVKAGFPVIIAGGEAGMYDMGLGNVVPYYWNYQSLNHIIVITGVTNDGNFLVRDSANVTDLFNPNSLRPGPRKYDASKLQLISATAIIMHGQQMPIVSGGIPVGVPQGWHDDGMTLTAPNGEQVVLGFRSHILGANPQWPGWDQPLEHEHHVDVFEYSNPSFGSGGGEQQLFINHMLAWSPSLNAVVEEWMGRELKYYRDLSSTLQSKVNDLSSQLASETTKEQSDQAQIASLNSQIASLQAQLAQPGGSISPDEQTAINNAVAALEALKQYSK